MSNVQRVRTPSGVLAVIKATAEKLLKEGIISGTIDGDLHANDAATVKAAIMAFAVCDFCSTPGASHYCDVPDFGVTYGPDRESNYSATKSTGGWMACDVCDAMVQKNDRKGLVDRAIETMAFPKFSRRMIEEFVTKFWQGMDDRADATGIGAACVDFIEDRYPKLPEPVASKPKEERIKAVMEATGLERKQVVAMMDGKMDHRAISKLIAFKRACGGDDRRMASIISGGVPPPLPDVTPHWQRAIDAKYDVLSMLVKMRSAAQRTFAVNTPTDLNDSDAVRKLLNRSKAAIAWQDLQYGLDIQALQRAETYSFGADPIVAITQAATLIPRDSPLSSVEVPTGAGWFWFSTPLQVQMTTVMPQDVTHALLWGWTDVDGDVAMRFAGFVRDDEGKLRPATAWSWPLRMTMAEMLRFNRENYARDYEKDGGIRSGETVTVDAATTLAAIEALSAFFLAACVWFKQKILVSSQGHIERHARKRIMREHKQKEAPTVRVIALRASARQQRVEEEGASKDGSAERRLHVRFVVSGHPRLQRCGPGRADVKLIWIAPYPKGPADAPFKERQKVFAVIR